MKCTAKFKGFLANKRVNSGLVARVKMTILQKRMSSLTRSLVYLFSSSRITSRFKPVGMTHVGVFTHDFMTLELKKE